MSSHQLIADYVSGVQTKELAATYNLTKEQVRTIVSDAGVARPSGGKVTYDPQKAIDLWNAGNSLRQIAINIGVNQNSVYEQLKKFGIDTKRRSIDLDKFKHMLDLSSSDIEIAAELGCSKVTVERIRREKFSVHTEAFVKSKQNELDTGLYLNSHDCTFEEFRNVFVEVDYSTLIRQYDKHKPNQRENKFRDDLICDVTDSRVDGIRECLERGDSKSFIRKNFSITQRMLEEVIQYLDIDYSPREYRIPKEAFDKLSDKQWCEDVVTNCWDNRREFTGCYGISQIELGGLVGPDTVRYYLDKHIIKYDRPPIYELYPVLLDKQWLELQYATKSYQQIAADIGVSHPTVRQALLDQGIEISRDIGTSKIEKQLLDAIRLIYSGEIVENDRVIINPSEIDILLPDLRIGIEVCGLYWHSEKFKPPTYHRDKMLNCERNGYRLITVFEDEIMFDLPNVMVKLSNILNGDLDNTIDPTFNEIQPGTFEVSNFVGSNETFRNVLDQFKNTNDWNEIVAIVDLRWKSRLDNEFVANGFTQTHVTPPTYTYYNYKTKKCTNEQNAKGTFLKVYDCGHVTYQINN